MPLKIFDHDIKQVVTQLERATRLHGRFVDFFNSVQTMASGSSGAAAFTATLSDDKKTITVKGVHFEFALLLSLEMDTDETTGASSLAALVYLTRKCALIPGQIEVFGSFKILGNSMTDLVLSPSGMELDVEQPWNVIGAAIRLSMQPLTLPPKST